MTLAVVGAVVGEFVGSNSGIGYVLQRSIGTFDLPTMFAALVILALLGVVLFWIVDRIERLVIPWHVSQREELIIRRVSGERNQDALRGPRKHQEENEMMQMNGGAGDRRWSGRLLAADRQRPPTRWC